MIRRLRPLPALAAALAAVLAVAGCMNDQPPQLPAVGTAQARQVQDACTAKGGHYVGDDGSFGKVCVFRTRDSGKACTRSSQCEGACLARSRTCSPIKPLLGCQDILTDTGLPMRQCVD